MARAQLPQPQTLQVQVEVKTLTSSAARQLLTNPVEIRRGEIKSIAIVVPLLSAPNKYLVARFSDQSLQPLMQQLRDLPEAQRQDFVRGWVVRTQQTIYEEYRRDPSRARFIVPSVPRRAEESRPPITQAPGHTFISQSHFWDDGRDQIPPGWRSGGADLPQEVRVRANYFQPRNERGKIPLGDGRVEEYNGRRYLYLACIHTIPSPPHPSISVFVQAK